jgi:putative methionine-R-sulfoxide reductase with GAF domain
LLDSNPTAAQDIAARLGPSVSIALANSVRKYTEANPESNITIPPAFNKLRAVFVSSAVPFIGFGIIDNAVMLVAGDYIDMTLGVSLGISTLAAAGLGNLLSDVGGVWAGGVIERGSTSIGVTAPMLTRAEENHQRTKSTENLGSAFGVSVGCLIGMLPLLFMDTGKAQNMKRQASTESIFREVFEEVHLLLHAERATLFLLSEDQKHLWSLVGADAEDVNKVLVPVDSSVAGISVLERRSLRVEDAQKHPKFFGAVDRHTGFQTNDLLCAPIINAENKIIGVIQVVNSDRENGFASRDESLLNAFCAHIGITLSAVTASDDDHRVEMSEALRVIKNQKQYYDDVQRML